jgi:xylulose-5-phosphate/fructose-6-phosphate phosphoketolase
MPNKNTNKKMDKKALNWLEKYMRYVNYLGAAQLYLKDNFFLQKPLKKEDIKERILGHWGTVPGLNFFYAHLNYLICKHKKDNASFLYIAGPGHGAPAVIANLFAEGTLAEYYPTLQRDKKGTGALIKMFSWPGGFPSHSNPGTPGAILEGGELGYSLATAYGSVMDNPNLITACIIGDGEAETGPLAGSWNGNKFLNPKTSGAVLPILHINGYKITSPTIYSTMSDTELKNIFKGFGYDVKILNCQHIHEKSSHIKMIKAMESAYQKIRSIQKKARASKKDILKPKWPLLIVRSLKGDTGIKMADGHKVEGTFHSHGIPINDPRQNPAHFKLVKDWLESYRVNELVDKKGRPLPEVTEFIPEGNLRMGKNPHANGGMLLKELNLPPLTKYALKIKGEGAINRGTATQASSTDVSAKYMRDIIKQNKKNFRFMCPDETESNKFQALFEVTNRAYMWPIHSYDENLSPDGRVMEILSEHNLQGWLQGYLLTGRHGIFVTYEAFATIIASMVDQYAKFIKQAKKIEWRKDVASLNYLLTSVGWRQEHNGYSHQNPSFISNILEKHGKFCSVYFPADANSLLVILEDCFKRKNGINVIVAGKTSLPQWLTLEESRDELKKGIGVWSWINPAHAKNPDVVMAATGDALVQESMAAIQLLKENCPELKLRFVNISELTALGVGDEKHPLSISNDDFEDYFTHDKPIIYNFHGYPSVIKKLIFGHKHAERFEIHGYLEEGTTTTPFEMMALNQTSRYHLAISALEKGAKTNPAVAKKSKKLIAKFQKALRDHEKYIRKYGKDNEELDKWKWKNLR